MRRLLPDDPFILDHSSEFGLGGFIVFEPLHDDRTRRKKSLFVVTPKLEENREGRFVTGNHFSFFVNKDAKPGHRLNFHRTIYAGIEYSQACVHVHNRMPLEFTMTDGASLVNDGLLHNSGMTPLADVICDIFVRPWANLRIDQPGNSGNDTDGRAAWGGARQRRRKKRRQANSQTIERFEDLWHMLPIHRMTVVAIRSENHTMDVTVFIEDRFQAHPWRASPAHLFKLSLNDENRDSWDNRLQTEVTRRMSRMEWDDFKDPTTLGE